MKSKLLLSLCAVAVSASLVIGGTFAAFSDYGTSNSNVFTAGTLDLTVDGMDNHDGKFQITNMRPGSQPTGTYVLRNQGTVDGFLNLSNISVTNNENNLTSPEILAGDTTADVGELQDVVNVRLYIDKDKDGYYSTGDEMFYNGLVKDIPTQFQLNTPIRANSDIRINAVFDWWDTVNDNLAQNDTMTINFRFNLTQRSQ